MNVISYKPYFNEGVIRQELNESKGFLYYYFKFNSETEVLLQVYGYNRINYKFSFLCEITIDYKLGTVSEPIVIDELNKAKHLNMFDMAEDAEKDFRKCFCYLDAKLKKNLDISAFNKESSHIKNTKYNDLDTNKKVVVNKKSIITIGDMSIKSPTLL